MFIELAWHCKAACTACEFDTSHTNIIHAIKVVATRNPMLVNFNVDHERHYLDYIDDNEATFLDALGV